MPYEAAPVEKYRCPFCGSEGGTFIVQVYHYCSAMCAAQMTTDQARRQAKQQKRFNELWRNHQKGLRSPVASYRLAYAEFTK